MSFLIYSISALIAFSGVVAGAILAFNTKEEMPTAKKYLPLLQKILLIAIVAVFLNHFKMGIIIKVIIYALVIFAIYKKQILNFYPIIAVLFFFIGQGSQNLFLISTLVFIYGFPTGSLYLIQNKRMKWPELVRKVSIKYGVFLVIAVLLQLLYSVFVLKTF